MAIKVRRGNEADFDKNKMQEGEFAAILDSEKVVISFGNGRVKELAGKEELDSAIKQLTNTTSSAIVCNAIGENLTISDCSALPFQAVRLQGNTQQDSTTGINILNPSWIPTITNNGVTCTNNGDNTWTFSGTITDSTVSFGLSKGFTTQNTAPKLFTKAGYYKLSFSGTVLTSQNQVFFVNTYYNGATHVNALQSNHTPVFHLTEELLAYDDFYVNGIGFWFSAGTVLKTGTVGVQIEYSESYIESASEFEPFTGNAPSPSPLYPQSINSAVVSEVKVRGKNLIPYPYGNASATIYGVKWIVNDDGSITANGTATEHSYFMVKYTFKEPLTLNIEPNESYIISGCPEGGAEWTWCFGLALIDKYENQIAYVLNTGEEKTFKITESVDYIYAWLRIGKGVTVENATFKPMIRSAKVADNTFELYKENAITLSEPIELNGIGSARDEVADGKKIRRFVQEVITEASSMDTMNLLARIPLSHAPKGVSDANIVGNFLCDKLPANSMTMVRKSNFGIAGYGDAIFIRNADIEQTVGAYNAWLAENPITVMYELSKPVVTEIPTEDVIALNSLHGYKPITYISTDSEVQAIIDVDYVADTKTYIDNKFNELAAALVAGSEV